MPLKYAKKSVCFKIALKRADRSPGPFCTLFSAKKSRSVPRPFLALKRALKSARMCQKIALILVSRQLRRAPKMSGSGSSKKRVHGRSDTIFKKYNSIPISSIPV